MGRTPHCLVTRLPAAPQSVEFAPFLLCGPAGAPVAARHGHEEFLRRWRRGMVNVAGAGNGGANTFRDGGHDFHLDVPMLVPQGDDVAGNYLLGGFHGSAIEFHMPGFAFGGRL